MCAFFNLSKNLKKNKDLKKFGSDKDLKKEFNEWMKKKNNMLRGLTSYLLVGHKFEGNYRFP